MEMIEANWILWGAAVLLVLLVAWLLLSRGRKAPPQREYKPDVLDQGAASVQRNQALIDAPPAVQVVPPAFGGAMAGVAEAVAVGAQDVVEEAKAATPPPPPEVPAPPPAKPEVEPVPHAPEVEPASPAPEIEPAPPAPETAPAAPPEAAPAPQEATRPEPQVPEPEPEPQVPEPEPAPPQPEGDPVPTQTPVPEPAPTQPENPGGSAGADDLSRIKGLGPKLQALLPTLGLTTYAQIAALSDADLAALDGQLGPFAGRPAKDNWVQQAQFLAEGDVAGFEAQFGKV